MAINKARKHSRYIIIAIFIILASLVTDVVLKTSIENSKRLQARNNLQSIVTCIDAEVKDHSEDVNESFGELVKPCMQDVRVGLTGDVYVLDYENLEFMADASNDVPKGTLYFTKESIGDSFKNWKSAEVALYWLTSGKDSVAWQNVWYNYDGSPEWLEWVNYTVPEIAKQSEGKMYIIVHGVQEDESLEEFKYVRYTILGFALFISLLLIAFNIQSNRLEE